MWPEQGTRGISVEMEMLYPFCINASILVAIADYSFAVCYHWGKHGMSLQVNLQLLLDKEFNF